MSHDECPQCNSTMIDFEIFYDEDLEFEYHFCHICDWSIEINHRWVE